MADKKFNITLAGEQFEVSAPVFRDLKKIVAAFNRLNAAGLNSDEMMNESTLIICLLLGKDEAEVEGMRIGFLEVSELIKQVPEICGLVKKEAAPGEAQAGSQ